MVKKPIGNLEKFMNEFKKAKIPLFDKNINFIAYEQEIVAKLLWIFQKNKDDVFNHITELKQKTKGLNWCINYASEGHTWEELKEFIK